MRLKAADAAAGFARDRSRSRRASARSRRWAGRSSRCSTAPRWAAAGKSRWSGHARIALDDPKIQLGLPEMTLGLIPGATGITKMARLLGLVGAQPYLLEGRLFGPREALELGLVDGLVADAGGAARGRAGMDRRPSGCVQPWDRQGLPDPRRHARRIRRSRPASASRRRCSRRRPAASTRRREAALAAMVEGAQVDYDTAPASRAATWRRMHGRPGGQEHGHRVLLQPERDQVGEVASAGRTAVEAGRRSASSAPA